MINGNFHTLKLGPKWQAYLGKVSERLKGVRFPGTNRRLRPPKPLWMRE